jgi:Protein of unknown function (DUF3644)
MPNVRIRAAYDLLRSAAATQAAVTPSHVQEATGWKPATVRTYLRKQWEAFVSAQPNGSYVVNKSFLDYPPDVFERINSQKFLVNKDPFKPVLSPRAEELVQKSRESAILAVQIYNNPTISFRTPGFIVQMIIAYTSLFHAIFEEEERDYVQYSQDGTPKLSSSGHPWMWSLGQCVKEYWGGTASPVRDNLRLFIELRDEIEHRFAPLFDTSIADLCQAMLLNYEDLMVKHFTDFFSLGANLAIPLQITRTSSPGRVDAMRELQRGDFAILSKVVESFSEGLPPDVRDSPEFRFKVLLVQVPANRPEAADFSMRFLKYDDIPESLRTELRDAVTLVKTKTVQAANVGNLRPSAVVKAIQAVDPRFRLHEHTQAWKYFAVRPREAGPEGCNTVYCQFDEAHRDIVYTQAWVEKLKAAVLDPELYEDIRSFKDHG